MLLPGHTVFMHFDAWCPPDHELRKFSAMLLDYAFFLSRRSDGDGHGEGPCSLRVQPEGGAPYDLYPLFCVLLTEREWELKREKREGGHAAVISRLEERFPDQCFRVLAARASSL